MFPLSRTVIIALLLLMGALFITAAPLQSVSAQTTRPGWGFGDTNHIHTGPPGQSVRPNTTIITQITSNINNGGNSISGNDGSTITIVTGAVSSVITAVVNFGTEIADLL